MDYAESPITFGKTPATGVTISVSGARGGYAGWILLGASSQNILAKVDGAVLSYPHTLQDGEQLYLYYPDSSPLGILYALAPVGPPPLPTVTAYTTTQDVQGFVTIDNANATADASGYQTLDDGTVIATDSDGFVTVERSTP